MPQDERPRKARTAGTGDDEKEPEVPTLENPRGQGLSRHEQDTTPVDGETATHLPPEEEYVQRSKVQG